MGILCHCFPLAISCSILTLLFNGTMASGYSVIVAVSIMTTNALESLEIFFMPTKSSVLNYTSITLHDRL